MMRKLISNVLLTALLFSLTACGSNTNDGTQSSEVSEVLDSVISEDTLNKESEPTDSSKSPAESSSNGEESTEAISESEPEQSRILVAYFSWSGNTKKLAEMIGQKTGGDLFEIEPQTPYTDDYNDLLNLAQQEQRENARPEVSAKVENWDQYDTVFVGYPNWWSDTPMLVLSFLESYDCSGKTIVPFCTSGGGGLGRSVSSVRSSAIGAEVLAGFHVSGSSVGNAQTSVDAWIDGLNIGA